MNEKLYSKRTSVRLDNGMEIEIPVITNNKDRQELYASYRQRGMPHGDAETLVEDDRQTQFYTNFVAVARHDGIFIKIPVYSDDPEKQQKYAHLRQMGESHNSAEAAIEKGSPLIGLCDTNLLKYDLLHNQFAAKKNDDERGDALAEKARSMGISTKGKFYHPGIAAEYGDPRAWVGSIGDIQQVCKDRGWDFNIRDNNMQIGVKADMSKTLAQQFVKDDHNG